VKKQIIIFGIMLVLITVGLSGCDEKGKVTTDKFLGKWVSISYEEGEPFHHNITFYSDGTAELSHMSPEGVYTHRTAPWDADNTKIFFNLTMIEGNPYERHFTYTFSNSTTLILQDEFSTIHYKKVT